MALKKAIVQYTNEHGDNVTRHLPIMSVVFDYQSGFVQVNFAAYRSQAARARGAAPEYLSQRIQLDPNDQSEAGLILAVSDALWTKIVDAPFIADFSDVDENGKQVRTIKSLADLNAQIVDAT
jgi:hypothetical protein